jgi:hypothetical protein
MTDLAKARELAQKLGYISPGLDVICSANTSPERLGELRAMGFNPIFDDAKHAVDFGVKLAESDPSGFRSWLTDRLQHTQVYAQASSTSLGRPPTMIEPLRRRTSRPAPRSRSTDTRETPPLISSLSSCLEPISGRRRRCSPSATCR